MKILRLFLRILLFPIVLLSTLILIPLAFLLALSTRILAIAASVVFLLSLLLFVSGNYSNGGIFLILALLISPCGLPLFAEYIWKGASCVRGTLWRFVFHS